MPDGLDSLSTSETWLLAGAVASGVLWLLVVAVVYLLRRPPLPPLGAVTLDLGPEPPAVANFLVHRFRVTRDAVPATLLDLAARNIVEIEQREPGVYVIRLRTAPVGDLTDYEQRVLDHLQRRESGGIVPAQALTTGPAEESSRWWRGFQREIVADSKRRGLSRDLLDRPLFVALGVAAAVPALLAALLAGDDAGFWVLGVALAILVFVKARHTQRETPEGLAAASRWRGVKAKLEENEVFPTAPPIAVALWERHLAYGAAFGIAPGAVRPMPMGSESDTQAWSSYGGRWRHVRVRYPRVYPLAWGQHPLKVLIWGATMAAFGGFVLYLFATVVLDVVTEDSHLLIAAAILLAPGLLTAIGATLIVRAVADSWSRTEVTGEIIRLRGGEARRRSEESQRRHYVAVDDGRSDSVRAWVVSPGIYAGLRQGQLVTVSLTRHLAHVRSITPVAQTSREEPRPLEPADLRPSS